MPRSAVREREIKPWVSWRSFPCPPPIAFLVLPCGILKREKVWQLLPCGDMPSGGASGRPNLWRSWRSWQSAATITLVSHDSHDRLCYRQVSHERRDGHDCHVIMTVSSCRDSRDCHNGQDESQEKTPREAGSAAQQGRREMSHSHSSIIAL